MADNVTLDAGSGGDTIAADDIGGVKYPRNKIGYGADGAYTEVAGATTGLPVQVSDGSSLISPATAGKQDTGNTSLASIDGKITAVNTGAVVVSSSALPSGASTSANQTTANSSLSSIDGKITACNTGAVTIGAALPAGTNAIGKLAANSGVDIGDVDVTSVSGNVTVVQGTATNLKAQAEAYQGGTAVGSGNPLQVTLANGSVPSHAVTNAGTFAVQSTLQAGTALAGKVSAGLDTASLYEGATALTPKFAVISCSSSGDNTLVAGVTSKKIRVLSIALHIVGTAISIYFRENTAGTAIHANGTNPIPLDKTGAAGAAGFVLNFNPAGWFQSSAGNPLVLNLSGAQAVAGSLTYVEAS